MEENFGNREAALRNFSFIFHVFRPRRTAILTPNENERCESKMKQQIFLALTVAAALCLTSCSPKETADKIGNGIGDGMEAVGEGAEDIMNGAESAAKDVMDGADDLMDGSTLGDEDGDGVIEDDQASGETKDTAQKPDTGSDSTVERVNSADDAVNFIGANV